MKINHRKQIFTVTSYLNPTATATGTTLPPLIAVDFTPTVWVGPDTVFTPDTDADPTLF